MAKLIVANWKMNGSFDFIDDYFEEFENCETANTVVFCPPSPYLGIVKTYVNDETTHLGGQDCHNQALGAYTGDVSAAMLRDCGCAYVILGHSERRHHHSETNTLVKAKAEAALKQGITPIICVGETLEQRQSGSAQATVIQQLDESLPKTKQTIVIAYEPVWAIGTGLVASLEDIANMHQTIASHCQGGEVKIIYGGSVTDVNAAAIMALPHVDGVLVGGASLKTETFMAIVAG